MGLIKRELVNFVGWRRASALRLPFFATPQSFAQRQPNINRLLCLENGELVNFVVAVNQLNELYPRSTVSFP
jgi:hypothetical protein